MNTLSSRAEVIHMADRSPSPQVEDGYTKIANELLDAMMAFSFSSRQYSVILAVMRKTYGYNKKTDDIGLSQVVKITGIDKAHISRTIRDLAEMRVIIRSQGKFGHNLSINKHYSQWGLPKQQPLATVAETATPPVAETATPPVAETATTKDNLPKDNLPKEKNLLSKQVWTTECFGKFWAAWPTKTAKKKASEAFAKLTPNDALLETLLAAIEQQKKSPNWIEDGGRFIPMAATWINGQRWDDEVSPVVKGFTEQQKGLIDVFNANIGDVCAHVSDWSQRSADAINLALTGTWGLEKFAEYFRYARDNCRFKYPVSFEWLMTRDNLVKVKRGDFDKGDE